MLVFRNYIYLEEKQRCKKIMHVVVKVIPMMWTVTSSTLHVLMVFLYAYPLLKHAMNTRKPTNRAEGISSGSTGNNGLMSLVRKCVVISLVCVVTDLTTMLITTYWIKTDYSTKLRHTLYNINAIFNVVCVVLSLKKWRDMLLPFCHLPTA